ncbi:MAG: hypothetical protein RR602_02740 [Longicatena sp.]
MKKNKYVIVALVMMLMILALFLYLVLNGRFDLSHGWKGVVIA